MGGGLLQLVAYGAQDVSLTGNPQITFFQAVFRRYTNFALQTIEQTLDGNFNPDSRISFKISRDGDLLSDLVLKTEGSTSDSFSFFDYIDCEIGGQLIDRQYNRWMNVWCDLTHNIDKTKLLNDLRVGFKSVSTVNIIDQNQPAPSELNNINVDQVINYPGTESGGSTDIVLHSSGKLYFARATPANYRISAINSQNNYTVDNNFSNNITSGSISDPRKLKIQGNSVFVLDRNYGYGDIARINVDQNGDYVSQENSWMGGGSGVTSANAGILKDNVPSITGGVDTVGYTTYGINDMCFNQNMMLFSLNYFKRIVRRYDNSDQHFSEQILTLLPTPTTNIFHSFANGSSDGPLASSSLTTPWTINAFEGPNIADPFIIITDRNHTVRKIDLNTSQVSTIAGIPNSSGNVDGAPGTSKIHSPMGGVISPDGSYVLITTEGSPTTNGGRIKKIDLSTNVITTLSTCANPVGIAIHPTLNYAYIVTYPGQLLRLDLSDNTIDVLVNNVGANGYPISMSPDGTFLLLVHLNASNALKRANLDSNGNMTGSLQTINVSGGVPSGTYGLSIMADSDTVILGNTNPKIFSVSNPGTLLSQLTSIPALSFPARTETMEFAYVLNSSKKLYKITLSSSSTITPNYYLKQHAGNLKDKNNTVKAVLTMNIDDNDNIYLCFANMPGLYKVDAGADRENTPTQLIAGSEALISNGENIFKNTNGDMYISCRTTGRVIKLSNDQLSVFAGEAPTLDGNGSPVARTAVNTDDPLTSSFVYPFGMCFTSFNDVIICDRGSNGNGTMRVIGGYKPVTVGGVTASAIPAYVPLQFWFCKNPGLAIPLIALQYHEVKIIIRLAQSLHGVTGVSAWGTYIFLDTDERRRFAQTSHEYLIEQVQHSNRLLLGSTDVINNQSQEIISTTELQFNHPVKELIWTVDQVTDSANSSSKACSVKNLGGNQNIIVNSSLIQMNGDDRAEKRDGKYYSQLQRYQRHSGAGLRNTRIGVGSNDITSDLVVTKWYPKATNAHVYSFGLEPEEHQPSGTCNFSRLDNAIIQNTISTPTINGNYRYFIDMYAVNYNVLRITSGMGGLAYSN